MIGAVAGLALLVVGFLILTGGDGGETQASATPTTSPQPSGEPGTRSGTVQPAVEPPATVACGGEVPPDARAKTPQFVGPPPMTIDEQATYTATIETSCGPFDVRLRPDIAPQGVNSFVFLANRGFYDGLTFHRIAGGFVIQGGDPLGDGTGGPGYQFEIETSPKQTFDAPGLLAYANGGRARTAASSSSRCADAAARPAARWEAVHDLRRGHRWTRRREAHRQGAGHGEPRYQDEMSVPTEAVYIDSITIDERTG